MIIDVNGFQMHCEERGSGEPLLLLHGGTGIGADWNLVFTGGDPEGFRLLVPDLRGHGRSTNPSRVFTFRQAADDIFALLDRLDVPRVKAIGLSMGAKTLLHMATQQPARIDAMVLVSARTLIVHGDRDPLYPVELALEMYRSIPGSALWVVPNGGHGPIFGPLAAPFVGTAMAHLTSAA